MACSTGCHYHPASKSSRFASSCILLHQIACDHYTLVQRCRALHLTRRKYREDASMSACCPERTTA